MLSLLLLAFSACNQESEVRNQLPSPTVDVANQWIKVEPGEPTRCSNNTSYAFWIRPGITNNAFIYFQGGGGCFDAQTCGTVGSYKGSIVSADDPDNTIGGVFDLDNPQNPFRDDHLLFIPYCTGDIHAGNQVVTYTRQTGEAFTIHHHGNINSDSALNWLFNELPNPERVFIAGCSAGSLGSIIHAPKIIEQYPNSTVIQFGDSGGGLTAFAGDWNINASYDVSATFPDWIPGMQSEIARAFTISNYTTAVSNHYPNVTFAQYNSENDSTQRRYYKADGGNEADFPNALRNALEQINSENFYSFVGKGERHCILKHPVFYTEQANGVLLRDWVVDLINGDAQQSVK